MTRDAKQPETLPAYAKHLWSFGFMNAVCFTICLGSPMVLCARHLGARESLIGFLLALTPLFTVLQIPAARLTDRWGYQKLMMAGWRGRAFMVLAMVPLPLLVGIWPSSLLLFLFTAFSLLFNVIRGFASGAWLPWVKHLIAPSLLGRYFSIESIVGNIAALLTLLASGFVLGKNPAGWQYAILLAVSGIAGILSVLPLAKAPDIATPKTEGEPERLWIVTKRVWANHDYRHLIRFAILNAFALGATSGFTVLFLKEIIGFDSGHVVLLTTAGIVGAMGGAFILGKYIDGTGSKPVMRVAGWGQAAFYATLVAIAFFDTTKNFYALAAILAIGGVLNNANGIALGRLVLNTCPREDLTVAMALSQVGMSLAAGIATVAWGFILEWLRAAEFFGHESRWPFFILYLSILLLILTCQILLTPVREEKALPTDRFIRTLLLEFPQRILGDLRGRP